MLLSYRQTEYSVCMSRWLKPYTVCSLVRTELNIACVTSHLRAVCCQVGIMNDVYRWLATSTSHGYNIFEILGSSLPYYARIYIILINSKYRFPPVDRENEMRTHGRRRGPAWRWRERGARGAAAARSPPLAACARAPSPAAGGAPSSVEAPGTCDPCTRLYVRFSKKSWHRQWSQSLAL